MTSIIFKGISFSLPFALRRTRKISYEVTFTESCRYELSGRNFMDWNKLLGLKTQYFDPHFCSCIIGHRYRKEKDQHELNIYLHDKKLYPDSLRNVKKTEVLKTIAATATIQVSIESTSEKWIIQIDNEKYEYPKSATKTKNWLIRDWFGGSEKPPHRMTKQFSKIK